jgi:hypothetical protein
MKDEFQLLKAMELCGWWFVKTKESGSNRCWEKAIGTGPAKFHF